MNILYLEDEPQDAALVSLYARSATHHLTVASNIADAQAALADTPDLILVDVMLGNTRDGFAFTRDIREQGFQQPVVAITALATARDLEECRRAGFDQVLTKPYTINQLAEIITSYEPS
jgi:two-component system capsular synthesis sensor histidine kinase RcsC